MFRTVQSLAKRLAVGMTAPHMLNWDIWCWSFEVEHINVTIGHNVEYGIQYQGCLFGCYSAPNEANWRGQLTKDVGNLTFSEGKHE